MHCSRRNNESDHALQNPLEILELRLKSDLRKALLVGYCRLYREAHDLLVNALYSMSLSSRQNNLPNSPDLTECIQCGALEGGGGRQHRTNLCPALLPEPPAPVMPAAHFTFDLSSARNPEPGNVSADSLPARRPDQTTRDLSGWSLFASVLQYSPVKRNEKDFAIMRVVERIRFGSASDLFQRKAFCCSNDATI
jgi:hypothetical protein